MTALIRLRLIGLLLALAFGLGGVAGAFAQRMPTLDDLAVVEALEMGATAADICGKDGKSLFAQAGAKATHATAGTLLPGHCGMPVAFAPGLRAAAPVPPDLQTGGRVRDGCNGCRAPPSL